MIKAHYRYGVGANKTPAEVIMEGAFGEMFFRDIYSSVNGQWYRKKGKNLS